MSTTGTLERADTTSDGRSLGRILSVDMLRGLAIIGVILYHLWDDIRNYQHRAGWFDARLFERAQAGQWSRIPTSVLDAVMASDFRVPMFMMLSGVSLYMATARKDVALDRLTFYRRRFRSLMVPYWFSVGLMFVVVCLITLLQLGLHGHGILYQYHHVTEGKIHFVAPGNFGFLASLLVFPRLLRVDWWYTPPGMMWFVPLILQYYLLFPFMYVMVNRHGPWRPAVVALAISVAARMMLVGLGGFDHGRAQQFSQMVSLFRVSEFALGVSLGYLLIHRRNELRAAVSAPVTIVALVVAGVVLLVGGNVIDDGRHYYGAFGGSITIFGVVLLVLPLLVKLPGRLEASAPLRALARIGPLTYALVIANEPLRLVASFLRVEGVPTAAWWLFLVLYLPLTIAVAFPLAKFLGIGRQTEAAEARPSVLRRRLHGVRARATMMLRTARGEGVA